MGGRTGVAFHCAGPMFIVVLFVAPLIGAVPSAATAPALVVVGCGLMMSAIAKLRGTTFCVAFLAFPGNLSGQHGPGYRLVVPTLDHSHAGYIRAHSRVSLSPHHERN